MNAHDQIIVNASHAGRQFEANVARLQQLIQDADNKRVEWSQTLSARTLNVGPIWAVEEARRNEVYWGGVVFGLRRALSVIEGKG